MKKVILFSLAFFAVIVLKGQEVRQFTNSNVFLELGGAGGISVNYERLLPINGVAGFSVRAGLGMYPIDLGLFGTEPRWAPIVPLMANFIYGKAISLETGLGLSFGFNKAEFAYGNKSFIKWYNATLGVRYQTPGRGFFVRFGFTPIITFPRNCQDYRCTDMRREINFYKGVGLSIGTRIK